LSTNGDTLKAFTMNQSRFLAESVVHLEHCEQDLAISDSIIVEKNKQILNVMDFYQFEKNKFEGMEKVAGNYIALSQTLDLDNKKNTKKINRKNSWLKIMFGALVAQTVYIVVGK